MTQSTNQGSELIYEVANSALRRASVLAGTLDPHTMVIDSDKLLPSLRRIVTIDSERVFLKASHLRTLLLGHMHASDADSVINSCARLPERRDIREVSKQIIARIPADLPEEQSERDFSELKRELEACAGNWFSAPEIEMPLWVGVASLLEEWLGEPKTDWPDWKWQVLAIFSGKEPDRNVDA